MSTSQWARRVAVTGCAAGVGLAIAGAGTASAQGDPTTTAPAPITISSAQVEQWCDHTVPSLTTKVNKLIDRIDGGPTSVGSTQWLRAQADRARANGHPARADVLDGRAERRTGVLTILNKVKTRLNDFTTRHCGGGR
ncbi:MAG TPA: hypothetical protein VHV49_19615 [Pseudonocardiaceae bacterium]|jgi:hypothetical protein|nr:hypothetical protein [Pseudonocardiaceae bacterium]